jgi:hypothetical protein
VFNITGYLHKGIDSGIYNQLMAFTVLAVGNDKAIQVIHDEIEFFEESRRIPRSGSL